MVSDTRYSDIAPHVQPTILVTISLSAVGWAESSKPNIGEADAGDSSAPLIHLIVDDARVKSFADEALATPVTDLRLITDDRGWWRSVDKFRIETSKLPQI
jgi:hypothetical protein